MNKKAFSIASGINADDCAFWWSKTPGERLGATEIMRQIVYGYDPTSQRLQRILKVFERPPVKNP